MRQWSFFADMTGDGSVTVSDVELWLEWAIFYPGDLILYSTMTFAPSVANFFELTELSFGGSGSAIISIISWCMLCFGLMWIDLHEM